MPKKTKELTIEERIDGLCAEHILLHRRILNLEDLHRNELRSLKADNKLSSIFHANDEGEYISNSDYSKEFMEAHDKEKKRLFEIHHKTQFEQNKK